MTCADMYEHKLTKIFCNARWNEIHGLMMKYKSLLYIVKDKIMSDSFKLFEWNDADIFFSWMVMIVASASEACFRRPL